MASAAGSQTLQTPSLRKSHVADEDISMSLDNWKSLSDLQETCTPLQPIGYSQRVLDTAVVDHTLQLLIEGQIEPFHRAVAGRERSPQRRHGLTQCQFQHAASASGMTPGVQRSGCVKANENGRGLYVRIMSKWILPDCLGSQAQFKKRIKSSGF